MYKRVREGVVTSSTHYLCQQQSCQRQRAVGMPQGHGDATQVFLEHFSWGKCTFFGSGRIGRVYLTFDRGFLPHRCRRQRPLPLLSGNPGARAERAASPPVCTVALASLKMSPLCEPRTATLEGRTTVQAQRTPRKSLPERLLIVPRRKTRRPCPAEWWSTHLLFLPLLQSNTSFRTSRSSGRRDGDGGCNERGTREVRRTTYYY